MTSPAICATRKFDNLANSHVERRWIDAGPGEICCSCAIQNL